MKEIQITPEYLAGVTDSDGSLTIYKLHKKRKNPHYQCSFQLTWKHSEKTEAVIKAIKAKYGGSYYIHVKNKNDMSNGCLVIKYCATGKAIDLIIEDIYPFLLLKQEQAKYIIELREIVKSGHYNAHNKKSIEVCNRQEELHIKNRELNSKNGKGAALW